MPDEAERSSLLNLLLDDLPGANLVAGYAMQRHPSWTTRTIPVEHFDAVSDLCAGWASGRHDPRRGRGRRRRADAHHRARGAGARTRRSARLARPPGAAAPGSMRRARRFDVVADVDGLGFDVHFRDIVRRPRRGGGRGPRVLGARPVRPGGRARSSSSTPPPTCCRGWSARRRSAAPPGSWVRPSTTCGRSSARDFVGTSTCTHLNDTLRALADLPAPLTSSL